MCNSLVRQWPQFLRSQGIWSNNSSGYIWDTKLSMKDMTTWLSSLMTLSKNSLVVQLQYNLVEFLGVSGVLVAFYLMILIQFVLKLVKPIPSWFPGASFQLDAEHVSKTLEDMAQLPYNFTQRQLVNCFICVLTPSARRCRVLHRLHRASSFQRS